MTTAGSSPAAGTKFWRTTMISCPNCSEDLDVDLDDLDEGEVISCQECGEDLEVITTDPIQLAVVGNDDDDYDEDEEE